jgi:osmoprotectant transport system permease protein
MTESGLTQQLHLLPDYLGNHILLSFIAIATSVAICLPLAIVLVRTRLLRWPVMTLAGLVQTIPGLALLALMVPLLGRIGFLPAYLALVFYSMLPILRNTVTGLLGIEPSIIEAAQAAGMTPNQMLFRVQLPLAVPVIIAGIRTASVWCVGMATLATPVGATSLGNYIFGGLQTQNFVAVLIGCLAAALLAIFLDQGIGLLERAAITRNRTLAIAVSVILLLATAAGMYPILSPGRTWDSGAPLVIGAKTFTEQYILADLISEGCIRRGIQTVTKPGMGSTILFDALAKGEVDCYVDYSGTIWATIMKRTEVPPRDTMIAQMTEYLQQTYHITLMGTLGFENTYCLAMSRSEAARLHAESIRELSRHARALSIGSDYEFFGREEWSSLRKTYDLRFKAQQTFDPSLMYAAIKEGAVDVISAYSTDGRIAAYDLVVLADPDRALPPYDAVLLLSSKAASQPEVVDALRPLLGSIDSEAMRQANKLVDIEGRPVEEAAALLRKALRNHQSSGQHSVQ